MIKMNEYENKILSCIDCGREFEFTASEQEFFSSKNLSEPKRCKEDRLKKKQQRQASQQY